MITVTGPLLVTVTPSVTRTPRARRRDRRIARPGYFTISEVLPPRTKCHYGGGGGKSPLARRRVRVRAVLSDNEPDSEGLERRNALGT